MSANESDKCDVIEKNCLHVTNGRKKHRERYKWSQICTQTHTKNKMLTVMNTLDCLLRFKHLFRDQFVQSHDY